MILDADTANEIDDLYAIARMLHQDQIELLGINSAQWFHYMSGMDSVHQSQRINEELLRITRREEIPALLGAEEALGMPWGGTTAKDSPAAQFIIEQARATPAGEKLIVACIGAATNLASAIKMAPDIAPGSTPISWRSSTTRRPACGTRRTSTPAWTSTPPTSSSIRRTSRSTT